MDFAGVAGSVVNRTEAHAVRLALIYALCAGHYQIEVDDLKAALALVDYSRRSAFKIFGSEPDDKRKSKILHALKNASGNEMTVTEISAQVFNRHLKSDELQKLLSEMEASKLINQVTIPTGGAPKTIVRISQMVCAKSELSEISHLNSLNALNSPGKKENSPPEFDWEDGI